MKTDKMVAFIPVRGGSKSIPLKNIKKINGQPLVYWVLDAAVNSKFIDRVFVSTDSHDIKEVISHYNKKNSDKIVCIGRSAESATDNASTESAMEEFAKNYLFDEMILIQATSPLLTADHLDNAIDKYKNENYDSMLSLVRQKRFIWKENSYGNVTPVNYEVEARPRRQEQEGYLVENGAFYITKKDLFLNTGMRISGKIGHYEMPENSYFEIDEPEDWLIVEKLLKNQRVNSDIDYSNVKLVAMDCDGVLTDAGMYYAENGDELKKFNTKDGMGIGLLHNAGIKTAIITGENTKLVRRRAEKLGIQNIYLGIKDKKKVMDELLKQLNLNYDEVAYIGDDINDLEVLRKVNFSFSVSDGMEIVRNQADYVTKAKGGQGAVREVAEIILNSKVTE
jgi:YrbI family 3-deoxy-D-manno-octulosonate 8-phosphate phosphatase